MVQIEVCVHTNTRVRVGCEMRVNRSDEVWQNRVEIDMIQYDQSYLILDGKRIFDIFREPMRCNWTLGSMFRCHTTVLTDTQIYRK